MTDHSPGLCQCGCGERTNLATMTSRRAGVRAGDPQRFIKGHQRRRQRPWNRGLTRRPIDERDYTVEDRGYLTPCWIWQHGKTVDGYGFVSIATRKVGAHVAIVLQLGHVIPVGMHVDHLCRVRACVNPEHLEVVTPQENGRRQSNVKLTRDQVAEIKASTEPSRSLALRYPVEERQIRRIRQGVRWADDHLAASIAGRR